jgi:predicted ATPase
VVNEAIAARGLVVQKKFEENSTNQLYLVLSAFNDLCKQLAEIYCFVDGGASSIWQKFVMEFGSSLHILSNILPNVIGLTPSPSAAFSLAQGINGDINFFSLCDLIKRFMRVLSSSSSIPVLMVLDDLQWSDPASLGLVHTVLSDMIGASCMFFVGIYRDNEVPEHHIVHGFHSWLSACNVAYSAVHLGGLPQQDVLSLISDSLGMLPRLCLSLSQVVYRKTEGNPLFVQTFLHSIGESYN